MENTTQPIDPFLCRCGCGKDVMQSLRVAFARLEFKLGRKLQVNSGARCASHNIALKNAAKSSLHMAGLAVDIQTKDADEQDEIAEVAQSVGFRGIGRGYGGTMLHLDLGYIRQWSYDKEGRAVYAHKH